MTRFSLRTLLTLSLLTALEIVLNRFLSINAWNIKIGFSFVPVVIGAMLYGPLGGAVVGALGDFIGALLFPIGPYFPGFTLTAFLTGAVFGLLLKKVRTVPRVLVAVGINQFILSLFLNTLWISLLYGSPYVPLLATRLVQAVVLTIAQIVVILTLVRVMPQLEKAASRNG